MRIDHALLRRIFMHLYCCNDVYLRATGLFVYYSGATAAHIGKPKKRHLKPSFNFALKKCCREDTYSWHFENIFLGIFLASDSPLRTDTSDLICQIFVTRMELAYFLASYNLGTA